MILIEINFIIPGEPKAKQRPRVCKTGHTYTPKETVQYEKLVRTCYEQKYSNINLTGELTINIKAYFSIPKSGTKLIKRQMLAGDIRPVKRPDWDNIGKIITDALNEVAYHDDAQIVEAIVEKYYSDNPRVEVTVKELRGLNNE